MSKNKVVVDSLQDMILRVLAKPDIFHKALLQPEAGGILITWFWKSRIEKKIKEILLDIDTEVMSMVQGHPEMNMQEILAHIAGRRRMSKDLNSGYSWEGLFLAMVITMVGRMFSNHPQFGTQEDYVTIEFMTAQLVVNRGGSINNIVNDLSGIYDYR